MYYHLVDAFIVF